MREHYLSRLDELVDNALEPNLCYEPWFLGLAMECFSDGTGPFFIIVTAKATQKREELICGLIPVSMKSRYRGLPVSHIALWQHPHCFTATPILHKDFAGRCANELIVWFKNDCTASVMSLHLVSGGRVFDEQFSNLLNDHTMSVTRSNYDRAYLHKAENADLFFSQRLARKTTSENRRRYKRLLSLGNVEWDLFDGEGDIERWVDEFILLEAAGWKGNADTAILSTGEDQRFFREALNSANQRSSLKILALRLNRKPIAMIVVIVAFRIAHTYKVAFDENFRQCAPGVMINLELIRRVHDWPDVDGIDTCAAYNNSLARRLYPDRLPLSNIILTKRFTVGSLIVKAIPTLAKLKKRLRPAKKS